MEDDGAAEGMEEGDATLAVRPTAIAVARGQGSDPGGGATGAAGAPCAGASRAGARARRAAGARASGTFVSSWIGGGGCHGCRAAPLAHALLLRSCTCLHTGGGRPRRQRARTKPARAHARAARPARACAAGLHGRRHGRRRLGRHEKKITHNQKRRMKKNTQKITKKGE
jgi:hypothetical protein